MKCFRFEKGEDRGPRIVAPGDARDIAAFLMQHACRPEQIDELIARTDSVLTGITRREVFGTDNARLEIDGGQYIVRAARGGSDDVSCASAAMALGTFRDLLVEWRAFIAAD